MSRSLFEQLDQVRGTRDFVSNLYYQYAENCGRNYSTGTFTVTSGSAEISDVSTFLGDEQGNFIVIDTGDAAGVYAITSVSSTVATVSPTPTGTASAVSGRRHYRQNLEDDLNYIRKMMKLVIGEDSWIDTPDTDLRNMSYLIPKRPNYVGETSQYTERPGTVNFELSDIDQTGKVSAGAPAGEYVDHTSNVSAGTTVRFTDDNTMVISLNGGFYPADTGTLEIVKDTQVVGNLDLATAWTNDACNYENTESDVGTNTSHTSSHTGIDIIDLSGRRCMNTTIDNYPSFWPPYQIAAMTATLVLEDGFNGQITIRHSIGGSASYTYTSFWVDLTSQAISASAPTISENTAVAKYLTGVPYYSATSSFNASITNSTSLFDRGYSTTPLRLNFNEFHAANATPTLTDIGLSEPLSITDTIGTYNTTFQVASGNFRNIDARATATYWNVFLNSTSPASNAGIFRIDTYGVTSTDSIENFDDEGKRFVGTEDFTNTSITYTDSTWDSTTDRSSGGQLVVYNGTLKYPSINHSTFALAGPDYSGVTNACWYYRVFIASAAFTKGLITFAGWSDALSMIKSAGVQVQLRYPNCSDYGNNNTSVWQDLSVDQTTYGADGCLGAGSSGTSVAFSFGTTSSAPFGNRIIMRIKYANDSVAALDSITFSPTL